MHANSRRSLCAHEGESAVQTQERTDWELKAQGGRAGSELGAGRAGAGMRASLEWALCSCLADKPERWNSPPGHVARQRRYLRSSVSPRMKTPGEERAPRE